MRNATLAAIGILLSFLAKPLFDRFAPGLPPWVWRVLMLVMIISSAAYALLQPTLLEKLRHPQSSLVSTTIVIALAFAVSTGATWALVIAPWLGPKVPALALDVQLRRPYLLKRANQDDAWFIVFPRVVITNQAAEPSTSISCYWVVHHRVSGPQGEPQIDPYHAMTFEALSRPLVTWEEFLSEGLVTSDSFLPVPLDIEARGTKHGYIAFAANGLEKNGFFLGQVGSISESFLTTSTIEFRDESKRLDKRVSVTGWTYIARPVAEPGPVQKN
jgi:hypothetical protein